MMNKRKKEPRNQPPAARRRQTIWACVDPEVKKVLRDIARARKRSLSWVVSELIDELLER